MPKYSADCPECGWEPYSEPHNGTNCYKCRNYNCRWYRKPLARTREELRRVKFELDPERDNRIRNARLILDTELGPCVVNEIIDAINEIDGVCAEQQTTMSVDIFKNK